ncbi:MAG: ABC transporter ATP-binding protein [Candidatus Acididesulfobacter diazotrophicus]|jgi:lipoprotein-releasing system ATP-binding protein|uniref:ABC transporter ATP-binding protein n=1 Tax=Candidatus Acididesulfobacter diazotrophicus TaxID=2597226 RepID=A0A519BME1_9DELT|nr:MAG: ABC transporter ATP-binding protein [Candidatus Acididesulfobacter diazotrophicus]
MNENFINAVSLRNVSKIFKAGANNDEVIVLKNTGIDIKYGDSIAITGESGTGKSTLLHIMGCLLNPDSGSVNFFDDIDVNNLPDNRLARFRNENIGFVFQFHYLLNEFNCVENVAMPLFIKGEAKASAIKKAKDYLCEFGLERRMYFKPYMLSGGEQQRTAVARALVASPKVILMDEPTGNLDPKQAESLQNMIFNLKEKYNKTLIVVTHDLNFSNMMNIKITIENGSIKKILN